MIFTKFEIGLLVLEILNIAIVFSVLLLSPLVQGHGPSYEQF
jgi:hypothetical protein